MFNKNQTPLTSLPNDIISPNLLHQLKSCWIETVEEMLAVTGILHRANIKPVPSILNELDTAINILRQVLPQEVLLAWLEPGQEQTRPLGNNCSEEYGQLYSSYGAIRFGNQIYSIVSLPLETSCDLSDQLLPVRDQGDEGVCVACTIASLMEYLTQSTEPLSVDFIYTCCKLLDGYLGIEGTDLKTAMGAVSRFGICTESMYEKKENPEDLMAAAAKNRVENIRQVLLGVIDDFKMKISGAEDSVPMPVAVSLLVFDSTVQSLSATKTGKWTLPIPGEPFHGQGHAMLIVGYQDDTSVPGGGYFIVRNSWGEDWANESLVGRPGYALIPYEYVQRFCTEAFTGPKILRTVPKVEETKVEEPEMDDFSNRYIFLLPANGREYTGSTKTIGRLVLAGKPVIARPDRKDLFKEDTEENRTIFIANDYFWDQEERLRNLFPDTLSSDWVKRKSFLGSSKCLFMESVSANCQKMLRTPFPIQKKRRWFFSRTLRIKQVNEVADLSDRLIQKMIEGVPDGLTITEKWREIMTRCNSMKIMRINAGRKNCYVAAAFVHPVLFKLGVQPSLLVPGIQTAEKVQEIFLQWLKEQQYSSDMNFMTLATCSDWNSSIRSSFVVPTVFTTIKENEPWLSVLPEMAENNEMRNPIMRDFINRLSPETLTDKITKVRNEIDKKIAEHFEGNILVRFVATATGFTEGETENIFRLLEETGEYEVYQVKKTLAIKKR